jgi:putative ABC transport system ATP-binding protein
MRIVVSGGTKRFGSRELFKGLDATFHSGQVTALVGPSGSGKSTLLGVLAGFQKLDSGTILIEDGRGGRQRPQPDLVSWAPQGNNALTTRTALDNVMIGPLGSGYGLVEASALSLEALKRVRMLDHRSTIARHLSGGELQRISFANTQELAAVLKELSITATVVVATHDPILMDAADSIVSIRGDAERPWGDAA